jgi:hypothetical protein
MSTMRTPAGTECAHYYEDFNRGRAIQICRLVQANPQSLAWEPRDCFSCAVPAILRANGSPHLELKLTIKRGFLGLGRKLAVSAYCTKHMIEIEEPKVGCPLCNAERPGMSALLDGEE